MKIKIKMTVEQLNNLIVFANDFLLRMANDIIFTNLETLNLKCFIRYGMKKLIDESAKHTPKEKLKTFSIDVNIIEALKVALTIDYNRQILNPLNLALYVDIQSQERKQISILNNSLNLH